MPYSSQITTDRLVREIARLPRPDCQDAVGSFPPLVITGGWLATAQAGRWPVYGSDAPSMDYLRRCGASPLGIGGFPLTDGAPLDVVLDSRAFDAAFDLLWSLLVQVKVRGLYLPGGGDLFPQLYGQAPHAQTDANQLWLDVWERYLLLFAYVLGWPTLGVCRGMQHMNVLLGGGLIQDLRVEWKSLWSPYSNAFARLPLLQHRVRGRALSPERFVSHSVLIDPQSELARVLHPLVEGAQQESILIERVLSMHHQAVGFLLPDSQLVGPLAPGYVVGAIAPDGVIEAIEWSEPELEQERARRFWLGVQWHPEWEENNPWSLALFRGFTDACRAYRPLARPQLQELRPAIRAWMRGIDEWAFRGGGEAAKSSQRSATVALQRQTEELAV